MLETGRERREGWEEYKEEPHRALCSLSLLEIRSISLLRVEVVAAAGALAPLLSSPLLLNYTKERPGRKSAGASLSLFL